MSQIKMDFEKKGFRNEDVFVSDMLFLSLNRSVKSLEERLEKELVRQCNPKILGGVTEGKLRVRGIKRIFDPKTNACWYEQRGFQITRKYKLKIEVED